MSKTELKVAHKAEKPTPTIEPNEKVDPLTLSPQGMWILVKRSLTKLQKADKMGLTLTEEARESILKEGRQLGDLLVTVELMSKNIPEGILEVGDKVLPVSTGALLQIPESDYAYLDFQQIVSIHKKNG